MVALIVADPSEANAGFWQRVRQLYCVDRPDAEILSWQDAVNSEAFGPLLARHNVFVLVKPIDETGWGMAQALAAAGKTIICDMFDNYLDRHAGLGRIGVVHAQAGVFELASLIVTSTQALRRAIQGIVRVPDKVVTIPDPLRTDRRPDWDGLIQKWGRAFARRRLNVLWFGIASHPYYASGLVDVPAIMPALARLQGFDITITVCTNVTDDIALLAPLYKYPYPIRVVDWTPDAQARLLRDSHVVIIPTNRSAFVQAKTHNRFSTAVLAGCLVLHTGHPEYPGDGGEAAALLGDPCPMNAYSIAAHLHGLAATLGQRYSLDHQRRSIDAVLQRAGTPPMGWPARRRLCVLWAPVPRTAAAHEFLVRNGHISAGVGAGSRAAGHQITFTTTDGGNLALWIDPALVPGTVSVRALIPDGGGVYVVPPGAFGLSKVRGRFRALQIRTQQHSADLYGDLDAILVRLLEGRADTVRGFSFAAADGYALTMASV